jgi:outer membrane lipoprotein-sorting protein
VIFRIKPYLLAAAVLLHFVSASAQAPDAQKILEEVRSRFEKVKDYEADINIKVDVDFVKIPEKKGKAWFAQPDRVKVKTEGFSLLPKKGMNFSPNQLLTGNFTAIFSGEEKVGGHDTWVIKVVPGNDDSDILLSKIWVDKKRMVIRRLESATRSQGTFEMYFEFPESASTFDLPGSIVFKFDLRKNEIPLGLTGDFNNQDPGKAKGTKNSRGTVTIRYLKYTINQGLGLAAFTKG